MLYGEMEGEGNVLLTFCSFLSLPFLSMHLYLLSMLKTYGKLEAIRSCRMFKSAEDFCNGKECHYVESYNNVLNIFQDKRIPVVLLLLHVSFQ